MKKKSFVLALAMALIVPVTLSGCKKKQKKDIVDGIEFEHEEEKKGPRFLDGSITSIQIGESVILKEIVDTSVSGDKEIKIVDPSGNTIDGSRYLDRPYKPTNPGDYKIIYKIKNGDNKGEATWTLKVVVKKISWTYTLQNEPYFYGETINFKDYFDGLNSFVDSYYPYSFVMDSVLIGNQKIDLHDKESYKFESMEDHIFQYHVESTDGQIINASENISIKFVNRDYLSEIESKNIKLYGELLVGDMNNTNDKSITFKKGQYNNGSTNFLSAKMGPHDLPYLVMDGNYGIGDLIKIDFTGNNMPMMSFFRDTYSNSVFDETKGCLISNGFYNNFAGEVSPSVSARVSQYGPYMVYGYCDRDYLGDSSVGTEAKPFGGSSANLSKLSQDNKYRLLCGFTGISKNQTDTYLTSEFALLDLTNHALLGKYKASSYSINRIGNEVRKLAYDAYDFPLDWYKGKIVLYGNYGKTTKIDKCPEIVSLSGRTFDEALKQDCGYESSLMKTNAPTNLTINKEYDPSLFGDLSAQGSTVYVTNSDNTIIPLVNGKIKLTSSGLYKVNYGDGTRFITTKDIYVTENEPREEDGLILYNAEKNNDGSYSLNAGLVTDGGTDIHPTYLTANDLSYIAMNGNYGLNDFLSVDFKGDNMPIMTFFRDKETISGSLFDNSKGVVVMGGLNRGDGEFESPAISASIRMYGPTLFYNYSDRDYMGDGSGGSTANPFPGSQQYLREHDQDTSYRVVAGFTNYDSGQHILALEYRLLDMTNRRIIGSFQAKSYNIYSIGKDIRGLGDAYSFDASYFTGDIAIYGNYAQTLSVDSFAVTNYYDIDALIQEEYGFIPSTLKSTAPSYIDKNTPVDASVFGDLTNEGSYVYLLNNDETVRIDPDDQGKINVSESGNYKVIYNDGVHLDGIGKVYVSSLETVRNGSNYSHGASVNDGQITLASGYIADGANYTGPNKSGIVDQAFMGYDGNYGLDTFIEFEFTGKNLPEIAFFANNYDNSMYEANGGKDGIVFLSGITMYNGEDNQSLCSSVNYTGVHMTDLANNGWMIEGANTTSKLARANLVDGKNYKLIIGFTNYGNSALDLQWCLYDKDTSTLVEESSRHTWNFFTGSYTDHGINGMTLDDFVGSIVLYGKFGIETTFSEVSIYENSTLASVKTACGIN